MDRRFVISGLWLSLLWVFENLFAGRRFILVYIIVLYLFFLSSATMFIVAIFVFVSLLDFDAYVQSGHLWVVSSVLRFIRDSGPQCTVFHHVFFFRGM